nr:hypothetical protein [Tanacetum cinerariifolium]
MIELRGTFQAWLQQRKDQVCQKIPLCYDNDNDEESSIPLRDIIISELPSCIAITPIVSTKESLIIRDEHLDTIPETKSDEFIKSSVENLGLNPSESEDEHIPKEIYSNPLFDEEIISIKIDPHHLNDESDLIESLLNQDSSIISSSKIDSLLDEFAGELILLKSIPPGIDEADCDPEEEIRLIKKLFDSLTKEIDLSLTPDDSMPSGIENDDYDAEGDILILEELLSNDSLSLYENESFHFDIPSSPRPPAKPPDNDDIEPNLEILTVKVLKYGGNRVKLSDLKQTLCGRHPMLILVVVMNKYKLDWNNPEGDRYPFDLSKPLPLQGPPGHRTVAADYFFNNDLEYLKSSDPEVTYTTSITEIKAARYEMKGIKYMVIKFSKQNVYSTKAILGVKSVSVKKLHGYGHLKEIVVKRSDQQLYKFKEGDFVDLHLNDIEDMHLLAVQHKLFHLDGSDIVDFIVALRIFTKSLILKRRVEELQLGIVYEDLDKHKRVLRADELYKFSNSTLKSVHKEIHYRVLDFRLDYYPEMPKRKVLDFRLDYNPEMPKRKWTAVDRKRLGLMIELNDKQLSRKGNHQKSGEIG